MKKAILGIVSTALLLGGCSNQAVEVQEEKLIPVQVQTVSKGTIANEVTYGGQIKAAEQIFVMSKTPGKVKEVYFDIGDVVQENEVLFRLDEKDIQNNIKVLESQLASAQVGVEAAETGLRAAQGAQMENQINQADTNVKRAELSMEDAKRSYEDTKKLYEAGSISKQQHDQAESGYKQAMIAYDAAVEAYNLLVNKISKENLESAMDRVNQAKASRDTITVQLQTARESLKDTAVRSPISGVVSTRTIDAGEMVGGTSVPFTIIQMNTVSVHVNVSETVINKVTKGQNVNVFVSATGNQAFQGRITVVSPAADERAQTFPIKIEILNEDHVLKPGMFAEVRLSLDERQGTIIVPRSAVLSQDQNQYVYIEEDGIAKKIAVETGLDTGKEIEITDGLAEGQQLIIKGQTYLSDGMKIQVITEGLRKE